MSDILVGIDIGTTVVKGAVFDRTGGRTLARAARRLTVKIGPNGEREQSVIGLDRACAAVWQALRERLGSRWSTVSGIGLAAQGGSTIIADRRTGRALTPMMLWSDTRALSFIPETRRGTPPAFWRKHTLRDEPGAGLARMLWLKRNRPELLSPDNIYVGAGEYCYFRLTGQWFQDAGSALQVGCYNAVKKDIDQRLLDRVGVDASFVAPMRRGHALNALSLRAARRLGLAEGIPVAGPYMDHEAGYLSAEAASKSPLQCSLGTAWVANFILPVDAVWSSPFQLVAPAITGEGWLVIQPLLTGNVVWDWGLGHLVDPVHDKALARAGRILGQDALPPDGLCALPWFNIPNPVCPSVVGAGVFHGMNLRIGRDDLLRALASGMTFELARVLREVVRSGKVDSVVLGGGASKGAFFRRLLAALFAPLPVFAVEEEDLAGTRGTLHAFSRKTAHAGVRRVKAPDRGFRDRASRALAHYERVYGQLCGKVGAGGPVVFRN